jgi:hypothetical protein
MNWNPVGFPRCVHDVEYEGFARVMSEHLLQVDRDALHEGVPSFGRSFIMSDSKDAFPWIFRGFGLDNLF